MKWFPRISFEHGDTEHITFSGERLRKRTILMRVGKLSLSKKAFILGAGLIICQVLDGVLTFYGLQIFGVQNEGNQLLRFLIEQYGSSPVLLIAKSIAISLAIFLMLDSHKRVWLRPVVALLFGIYVTLAILPWSYLISRHHADNEPAQNGMSLK